MLVKFFFYLIDLLIKDFPTKILKFQLQICYNYEGGRNEKSQFIIPTE